MAALFLEPLLHGFRSLRELFRTLAGETTALEAFFLFCWLDGVIERDDIDEIVWEVQV